MSLSVLTNGRFGRLVYTWLLVILTLVVVVLHLDDYNLLHRNVGALNIWLSSLSFDCIVFGLFTRNRFPHLKLVLIKHISEILI